MELSKKIGLILLLGLGKMGNHYIEKLLQLGFKPSQIIGMDIDFKKVAEKSETHPGCFFTTSHKEALERNPDVAIIAVNSPAHLREIQRCLEAGIERIFSEKPMVMNMKEVELIKGTLGFNPDTLLTAFLIQFSGIMNDLFMYMKKHDLYIGYGSTVWGKNWPNTGHFMGPDLEDETPHPLGVFLSVLGLNQDILDFKFKSSMTTIPHNQLVDLKTALDSGYGLEGPINDTTFAEVIFQTNLRPVPIHFLTSFNFPSQIRLINLCLFPKEMMRAPGEFPDCPPIKAELQFDLEGWKIVQNLRTWANAINSTEMLTAADKVSALMTKGGKKSIDVLRIIKSKTNIDNPKWGIEGKTRNVVLETHFAGDKIKPTLEAALQYFIGEKMDPRTMSFQQSVHTVELLEKIAQSHS